MARADSPPVADARAVAADAAALVASTDVEAAIVSAMARVTADALAAQRKNQINALWERMQAAIALILVVAVVVAAYRDPKAVPLVLTNALFVVLGFYFGRTNHARPTPTRPRGEE